MDFVAQRQIFSGVLKFMVADVISSCCFSAFLIHSFFLLSRLLLRVRVLIPNALNLRVVIALDDSFTKKGEKSISVWWCN